MNAIGRALAPRGHDRGVQEYQCVSTALEGGVAMPRGVGHGAFVNLPAGPFVPVAAGAAGPHDPPGPVRRPILAAVPVVLVVGDQSHEGFSLPGRAARPPVPRSARVNRRRSALRGWTVRLPRHSSHLRTC